MKILRKLVALAAAALFAVPAFAAPLLVSAQYLAIANTDTTIQLHRYCRAIQIWSDLTSSDVYIELNNNAATVGGATTIRIAGGGSWSSPPNSNLGINGFHYIGATASGHLNVVAY